MTSFAHRLGPLWTKPSTFFSQVPTEPENRQALILGFLALFIGIASEALIQSYLLERLSALENFSELVKPEQIKAALNTLKLSLWFSPITAFFGIHLFASALHLMARNFQRDSKQEVSYASTLYIASICQLPMIFCLIPIIGPFIASTWVFVLLIYGVQHFFKISFFFSALSILSPAIFLKFTWGWALQQLAFSL